MEETTVVKNLPFEERERRFRLCLMLQQYYAGKALSWNFSQWQAVSSLLADFCTFYRNDPLLRANQQLRQLKEEDLREFPFAFNRLFVGPDRLLASPYESSYLNREHTLMQQETLQVRAAYAQAGLEVAKKGKEPDDHMALELEFLCYLLAKGEGKENPHLYYRFLRDHPLRWYREHCELIRKNTDQPLCRAMADILEGFFEVESKNIVRMQKGEE